MTGRIGTRCFVLATVLGLAGALTLSPASAESAAPGPGGRIVVAQFLPDRIITMLPDGSDRQLVTKVPSSRDGVGGIDVTDDGATIAVSFGDHHGRFHIFTVNSDGSDYKQVTFGPFEDDGATFSPDGSQVAFNREQKNGKSFLEVMNVDGTGLARLTDHGEPQAYFPSWSPDGRHIAFSARSALVVTDPHGSRYRYLRRVGVKKSRLLNIDWSPDSKTIIYSLYDKTTHTEDLYTIGLNGGNRHQLTDTPGIGESAPAYSPDGGSIGFIEFSHHGLNVGVMEADGSHRKTIVTPSTIEFQLAWGG